MQPVAIRTYMQTKQCHIIIIDCYLLLHYLLGTNKFYISEVVHRDDMMSYHSGWRKP